MTAFYSVTCVYTYTLSLSVIVPHLGLRNARTVFPCGFKVLGVECIRIGFEVVIDLCLCLD